MGRKLDLTGLTDGEAAHVLQVVQRDMKLRKKEEERLSELKQELDEEGSRCLLLSRQTCFNQRCCIRCCSPFTFLLNPKRQCRDCSFNVCKACRVYSKRDKAWLCSACQKCRLVKTQSLEWFYTNVKKRFKRFGSAKVLKTLYRKHLAEHSALSELTEGSACEESVWNEGSVCGSDSTFYRRTEEHSLAETLSVAMRVAEEAIDEAISKAEFDTSTQEKQNEARYLREHRGELIEELAKTIVQKIISRRNALAEMRAEYDDHWPPEHNTELHHHHPHPSTCDQGSGSLKPNLRRSHSAFTLLDDSSSVLEQDFPTALKKEGGSLAMTAWKSVDRLDNSVLKSPDGNWIALQSAQLSRPSLLTKRKSLVYSALERESGVVSAYERLGSDNETKPEPDGSWGSVLQEIHRKMTDSDFNLHDFDNSIASLMGDQVGRDDLFSDSEGNWTPNKPLLALLKRKVPAEIRKPSSARRTSIIDVNFNPKAEEEMTAEPETRKIRKSRKKRRSKKEPAASSSAVSGLNNKEGHPLHPSDDGTSNTLTSEGTTPEPFEPGGDLTGNRANQTEDFSLELHQLAGGVCEHPAREEEPDKERDGYNDGQRDRIRRGRPFEKDTDLEGGRTHEDEKGKDDEEMKYRIYRLVSQSSLPYFSSTEDELDRVGQNEGEWDREIDTEEEEQKTEQLTYRLCQLEKRVRGTQFSSTEDELDKMSVEEEEGKKEDLAVKLCRLANEVNAAQFSSTEDELDRAGRGEDEEEVMNEEALWKLQSDKTRLRDLVSLVRASQFSSTEDELDRVGENEGEVEEEVHERGTRSGTETEELWDGAESIGDFDLKMFEFREERKEQSSDGKITSEDLFDSQTKMEDDETDVERSRNPLNKKQTGDATMGSRQLCDKKEEILKGDKSEERREIPLKKRVEAERAEASHEMRVEQQKEPEANRAEGRIDEKLLKEIKESERKSEMAVRSDEEDEEFDKIISSMLMMSLEGMQAETMKDKNRRENEVEKDNREVESGSREAESVSDEESAVSEGTEGDISNEQETKDVTGRRENTQEERQLHLVKETFADITKKEILEEAKLTSPESEDEKQGGRGDMMEWEAAERQADSQGTGEDGDLKETTHQPEDDTDQSSSAPQGGFLSPEEIHKRYSASSLCSITTEVLKVLNATEELLEGAEGRNQTRLPSVSLPPNTNPKKLEQQFWRLEENVYVAAGSVYSLEAELSSLEECARGICSSTSDIELTFLEEQVAAAAARVQHSELQISNISARIAALKNAGLNVDPQSRFTKTRSSPDTSATLDSSRHLRRRLPAPPVKEDKEA